LKSIGFFPLASEVSIFICPFVIFNLLFSTIKRGRYGRPASVQILISLFYISVTIDIS